MLVASGFGCGPRGLAGSAELVTVRQEENTENQEAEPEETWLCAASQRTTGDRFSTAMPSDGGGVGSWLDA